LKTLGLLLISWYEQVYDCGMCTGLGEAIEELSIPLDGDALAEALALRDRLDARIAQAVAEFDRHQLWDMEGATSLTAWLVDRAGMTRRGATHNAARARRLDRLPVTSEAWRRGELTGGQVDAIVGNLDDATIDLFADHEPEVVPVLVGLSVRGTGRAMGVWRAHAAADGREPDESGRSLHLSAGLDGSGMLDGTLTPEGYALVKRALELAQNPDVEGEPARTPAQRRHDALVDLSRFFLDTSTPGSGAGTGLISTSWSTWTTSSPGGAAGWSTAPTWTRPPPPGCCATAPCTGW
jgi:hypothetical protein